MINYDIWLINNPSALSSPIVGWLVTRIGLGCKFREIDLRIKKLELLDKAASLSRKESEGQEQVNASMYIHLCNSYYSISSARS